MKVLRVTFILTEGGVTRAHEFYFEEMKSPKGHSEIENLQGNIYDLINERRGDHGRSIFLLDVTVMAWQEMDFDKGELDGENDDLLISKKEWGK